MKKTIVMLMVVMVATPCLAQEIKPEGLFSIEGTEWMYIAVGVAYWPPPFFLLYNDILRFTNRSVQISSGNIDIPFVCDCYLDFLVFSVALEPLVGIMILQPVLGVGMFAGIAWDCDFVTESYVSCFLPLPVGVKFGYMFKCPPEGCDYSN